MPRNFFTQRFVLSRRSYLYWMKKASARLSNHNLFLAASPPETVFSGPIIIITFTQEHKSRLFKNNVVLSAAYSGKFILTVLLVFAEQKLNMP